MDCPHIPDITYGAFLNRVEKKTRSPLFPMGGTIDVTERCNLRCKHCYINRPANDRTAIEKELSTAAFCRIIDQLVDEGCLWVLLTGGEIFLRKDFLEIYTYAKNRGLLITLFTNGTLITPAIADVLADFRPLLIEITIYGSTEETFERVTGVQGSFKRCMAGIELLLKRNIRLKLKSVLMSLNKHELGAMKKYADDRGLEFRFDAMLHHRVDKGPFPVELRLSPEEIVALDLADEKRPEAWRKFFKEFNVAPPRPDLLFQCGAGKATFHLDASGLLSVCMMTRSFSFDLLKGSLHTGWQSFFASVLQKKWIGQSPCKSCNLYAVCSLCPGWAQLENNGKSIPVEFLCRIAHLRAAAFGKPPEA